MGVKELFRANFLINRSLKLLKILGFELVMSSYLI